MREILFRGKRLDNGEWVEGAYCHYDDIKENGKDSCDYIIEKHTGEYFPFRKVISSTVGQCTGLQDKNGNRIFEGDIVCHSYYFRSEDNTIKKRYGIVACGEFNCSCCDGVYGWHFGDEDIREYDSYVVVGNIHDNPELLEGGQDE